MQKKDSKRKQWTTSEWNHCKDIIKKYELEHAIVISHKKGGYNRTIHGIKSYINKKRHNEIVLVKCRPNRGFTHFESEALFTYIIDSEFTYRDVMSNDDCTKQIANFFMRTPENIRKEVKKNLIMFHDMNEERRKSQHDEGLLNAPTGEVHTISQPKQQCVDNDTENPFTQISHENDEICQPQITKTIHSNKNTPIEKQFGKQLTVLDTINEKENRLQAILIKLNPTLSKSKVLGTVCKFLIKCKGLQISDGENDPIVTLCGID